MTARVRRTFEAVLFDFGGVFTPSPFRAAEDFARDLGAAPARLLELVFGPYHEDTDHPWHRLERGELSFERARAEIIALGARESVDADPVRVFAVLARGGGTREARPEVVACVRELRGAGLRTALVTNNAREFRERWARMLPLDELFDAVVDSSEVGVRKPDPAIYRLALARLGGLAPERAVFLDDFAGNVEAARALGMRGVLVGDDPGPALAELRALVARAGVE
jgi:epoxide hydrolase-like predicted phosphatase